MRNLQKKKQSTEGGDKRKVDITERGVGTVTG